MADVTFTLEAEEAKAVRSFLRVVDAQKKSEDGFKRITRASKKAGTTARGEMDGAARSALNFGKQLVGISSAVGGIVAVAAILRREWENLKQVQTTAAAASISMAQARGGAVVNLPPGFSAADLDKFVSATSVATGVKERELYVMAQTALSAKGGVSQAGFFDAMRTAATLSAKTGLPSNVLVGGALDLATITGMENAAANIGWMRQMGSQARTTDLSKQMRNLLPAIQSTMQFGETPESGAEWAVLINSFIKDEPGEMTRTGLINLSERLAKRKVVPGAGGGGGPFGGGGKAGFGLVPEKFTNLEQRLTFLSEIYKKADRKMQGEMLEKIGGEGLMRGFTAAALSGDPQVWERLKSVKSAISAPGPASEAGFREMMASIQAAPQERVASIRRTMAAAGEKISTGDVVGARAAVTREGLNDIMERAGVGWTERKILMTGLDVSTRGGTVRPTARAIEMLESRASMFEREMVGGQVAAPLAGLLGPMPGGPGMVPNPAFSPENAGTLREVVDVLKDIRDGQRQLNQNVQASGAGRQAGERD